MSTSNNYAVLCGPMQFSLLHNSYMITIKNTMLYFWPRCHYAIECKISQIFK